MSNGNSGRRIVTAALILLGLAFLSSASWAQSAGTGALAGTVLDTSGAGVPNAKVMVTSKSTGQVHTTTSGATGFYRIALLPPDTYDMQVEKSGFKTAVQHTVTIVVTQTETLDIKLELGAVTERVVITAEPTLEQTESSALGRAVNERDVTSLPLVTRNYQEILTLSPGIAADVPNAAGLGSGSGNQIHAHGARATDDSFEMNGVDVNDLFTGGTGSGGGTSTVPVPNPDTIQEFKVQTGQYDAAYGRNAGANVQLVTKSGTNDFHGDVFEYFRNTVLNANDFFFNAEGTSRGALNENQFGGVFGGPIKKDRLLFFGSYQGTRQKNGVDAACQSTVFLPVGLTDNNRTSDGLATLFAGQQGLIESAISAGAGFQLGPAVDPNCPNGCGSQDPGTPPPFRGSSSNPFNISPAALALLQLKLPNGQFYIPNPQVTTGPLAGLSSFSTPCRFNEDQYVGDVDYLPTTLSKLSVKYFIANQHQTTFFANGGAGGSALPGSPQLTDNRYQSASVAYSYAFNSKLLNEARFAWNRYNLASNAENPFTFSGVGITANPLFDALPNIVIQGCCALGAGSDQILIQNATSVNDSLSYLRGRHSLRFGGGFTHYQNDVHDFAFNGINVYQSFGDFLVGLSSAQNGTRHFPGLPPNGFSNVIASIGFNGLGDRDWRTWDGNVYAQDDIKVTRNLTVNVGVRYEHLGDLADALGRNANFYPNLANRNPPAGGTLEGFVVSSNIGIPLPDGVTQLGNRFGVDGDGQNKFAPRIGFAWQILPQSAGLVLRGGYGIYYSRTVGNATFQLETTPPFGLLNVTAGPANFAASGVNPFPPSVLLPASSFPIFPSYSPTTNLTLITLAPNYQPPITQQYSLGLQKSFANNFLAEITYFGARGTKLINTVGLNQALDATVTPINGQTTNTLDNIQDRLPFQGFASGVTGIDQLQNSGWMWYNGVDASLTKRFSGGLQFLASYTFARDLDTGGGNPENNGIGQDSPGNQARRAQYGPAAYTRDHRFVLSFVYEFPTPNNMGVGMRRLLGGWAASGVVTLQSGAHLTLTNTNESNAFGVTNDVIQLASGCTAKQLVNPGSVQGKLGNYFNASCISNDYPIIGTDGLATGFGNGGIGSVVGPGQKNINFSLAKVTKIRESVNLEFRASFFNLFNTPQFGNPDTNFSDSNFGRISSLSVNPRIGQLALKLIF
jgi:hypothetical protein